MKIKMVKTIGFIFLLLSIFIVSYFCYQNFSSAKEEPKRAKLVINIEGNGGILLLVEKSYFYR